MTNSELNRDIKRLHKAYLNRFTGNTENWTNADWSKHEQQENEFKAEFKRLYYADKDFEVVNKQGILIMLALNNTLRVIPFHVFGAITVK